MTPAGATPWVVGSEWIVLPGGRRLLLRPVVPDDAQIFTAGFAKLSLDDIRMRFFAPMSRLSDEILARLTQIDPLRELALAAVEVDENGREELFGVVRLIADPSGGGAEFAVIVDSAIKGQGLGRILMRKVIEHARRRGLRAIWGHVLRENARMLRLCGELGFSRESDPDDHSLVKVVLPLGEAGDAGQASSRSSE